eukprot:jgi/Bigna1/144400/aug1.87_g19108
MNMKPIDMLEEDGSTRTWVLVEEIVKDTEAVAEERRKIEGFEYANTLITIFNTNGEVLIQNPRAKEYYDVLAKEGHFQQGSTPLKSILRDQALVDDLLFRCSDKLRGTWKGEIAMPILERHSKDGKSTESQTDTNSDNEEAVWHDIRAVYNQDPVSGKPSIIMNQSDISELKHLQDKVIKMQEERFKRVTVEKDRFFAGVSHELRTPLHGIMGLSQTMMENETDPEIGICDETAKRNLKDIFRSGERLLNLVNEILNMSKIKEGKMALRPATFDFKQAVREVMKMLENQIDLKRRVQIKKRNVKLINEVESVQIVADRERIVQILYNLIGNACKFTKEGHVKVVSSIINVKDKKMLQVMVEDTGKVDQDKPTTSKRKEESSEIERELNVTSAVKKRTSSRPVLQEIREEAKGDDEEEEEKKPARSNSPKTSPTDAMRDPEFVCPLLPAFTSFTFRENKKSRASKRLQSARFAS